MVDPYEIKFFYNKDLIEVILSAKDLHSFNHKLYKSGVLKISLAT